VAEGVELSVILEYVSATLAEAFNSLFIFRIFSHCDDSLKSLLSAYVSGTGVEVLNSLFCAEIHQM
jgi:hypothetical protein